MQAALEAGLAPLPPDKPRLWFGSTPPRLAFPLVRAGLDLFDTSYPSHATERDCALVFPVHWPPDTERGSLHPGPAEICLADPEHRLAMEPLVAGCTCHACTTFTRAYLHHLVSVKEMLARVLLQIHNIHHYQTFFSSLHNALQCDQLDLFQQAVLGTSSPQPDSDLGPPAKNAKH